MTVKDFLIKDIVKDNMVHYSYYRQGFLFYEVTYSNSLYSFPVPVSDIGDATFLKEDKAIYFMSYIKKALEDGTFVKV